MPKGAKIRLSKLLFMPKIKPFFHVFFIKNIFLYHAQFLTNGHSLYSQNTMASFEYVDFWPKILPYSTHHLWNSTTELTLSVQMLLTFFLQFSNGGSKKVWTAVNIILPNIISLEKVNLPIFFRNLPDLLNYVVCIAKGGLVSEGIFTLMAKKCAKSLSFDYLINIYGTIWP